MELTLGQLVDALSIVNQKIFHLENVKQKEGATNDEIAEATKKTGELNKHRNKLIAAIDKQTGQESASQIKMYGNK